MFSLNQTGLAVNIIGSLFIAFSIGRTPGGTFQNWVVYNEGTPNEKTKKFNVAIVRYPKIFFIGIILLILGFLFQIFS